MSKPLSGTKIAFLAANGFNEQDMTSLQRALMQAGSPLKIVSPEAGLINGWMGQGFGHHYPVDASLSTALGVDYDMLVIPGGTRSLDKLEQTAHTKRFVGSIMALNRPVIVWGDAVRILARADLIQGRSVSVPADVQIMAQDAGARISADTMTFDHNLGSIICSSEENRAASVTAAVDFFISHATMAKAA